jgi:hypothetical protein
MFAAGVIVQGYLAGQALRELGGTGDFGPHIAIGYSVMGLLALVVLVAAIIGRLPRGHVGLSLVLVALYFAQTSLPYARSGAPFLAALHPANAMLLLVLAIVIAWRARRIGPAGGLA